MSRQLINALPRLFHKHQTDEHRISYVLRLPDLVNLDMYLDMRMLSVRFDFPAFTWVYPLYRTTLRYGMTSRSSSFRTLPFLF